jgi:hypothetical protein
MIAAVLVSCKKNTTETPAPAQTGEIEFNINSIYNDLADRNWNVPICDPDLEPLFVQIWIQPQSETDPHVYTQYTADVYYIGDQLYTKALQFTYDPNGENCYRIVGFNVMALNPDYDPDDPESEMYVIYKATPAPHSEFAEFVVNGLTRIVDDVEVPFEFCIIPFQKQKLLIDVLCFIPDEYELFGFFWFEITEITVREMCFFGDLCLKDIDDYTNSPYDVCGDLFIDMPAIFQIWGTHNGEPMRVDDTGAPVPYTNEDWCGIGDPLCIKYADYDYETDYYVFELWVMVKVGSGFDYVKLFTWTWQDDFEDTYNVGDDGVAEFVVGNCNYSPTDFQIAPYMNLPTSVTMQLISNGWNVTTPPSGGMEPYWTVNLSNFVPAGTYDIPAGNSDGWCGDMADNINAQTYNNTLVFSSLDPYGDMPYRPWLNSQTKLEQLNYLANHWMENGLDVLAPSTFQTGDATTVQQSIWAVTNTGTFSPPGGSLAATMAAEALSSGAGYSPLPGGFAFVMFFAPGDGGYQLQLILIAVDP